VDREVVGVWHTYLDECPVFYEVLDRNLQCDRLLFVGGVARIHKVGGGLLAHVIFDLRHNQDCLPVERSLNVGHVSGVLQVASVQPLVIVPIHQQVRPFILRRG